MQQWAGADTSGSLCGDVWFRSAVVRHGRMTFAARVGGRVALTAGAGAWVSCGGGEADASAGSGSPVRVDVRGRGEVRHVLAHVDGPAVVVDPVVMVAAEQDTVPYTSLM